MVNNMKNNTDSVDKLSRNAVRKLSDAVRACKLNGQIVQRETTLYFGNHIWIPIQSSNR